MLDTRKNKNYFAELLAIKIVIRSKYKSFKKRENGFFKKVKNQKKI